MGKRIKVTLLGVSHWHLPLYLLGLPEDSVVGISGDDIGIAARYAGKYSYPAYQDYRQIVMETKPDFVFAFAPHYRMKKTAKYLLQLGIPFSIEKPADMNANEVESLYGFCEKKSGFRSIPFVWRYGDAVNNPKSKYLTKPITHMPYRFIAGPPPRYLETSSWILSQRAAGGGCMANLGVHFIDMALFLTDSCSAKTLASTYQHGSPYDVETYTTSLLELLSGTSLILEGSYAYPMSENSKRENRWTTVTENGYYILAENRLEIREYDGEPAGAPLNMDSDICYTVYTKTTLNDRLTGAKPRTSLKGMLGVNRILDDMNAKAGL